MAYLQSKRYAQSHFLSAYHTSCIDGETLLRDLWRTKYPRISKDSRTLSEMSSQEVVPNSVSEYYDWAHIGINRQPIDRTRNRVLLLNTPTMPNIQQQVAVNVQGIVCASNLNLAPLGNYDGR